MKEDIEGLMNILGGDQRFASVLKLDQVNGDLIAITDDCGRDWEIVRPDDHASPGTQIFIARVVLALLAQGYPVALGKTFDGDKDLCKIGGPDDEAELARIRHGRWACLVTTGDTVWEAVAKMAVKTLTPPYHLEEMARCP